MAGAHDNADYGVLPSPQESGPKVGTRLGHSRLYYVVDGHHCVAVAKEIGQVYIDAEVPEYVPLEDVGPSCVPYRPTPTGPLEALLGGMRSLASWLGRPAEVGEESFCPYRAIDADGQGVCTYPDSAEEVVQREVDR